jgi:N-acetylmuramoyl-L-alanine amidase
MRSIKRIFIHCTASPQTWGVKELQAEFKSKQWSAPGYHYVVTEDGTRHQMWPLEKVSNGVHGYNSTAVNIAYVGGVFKDAKGKWQPIDNRTEAQKEELRTLVKVLHAKFPKAEILGHRDISPDTNNNGKVDPSEWIKTCPCFDVRKEYADIINS